MLSRGQNKNKGEVGPKVLCISVRGKRTNRSFGDQALIVCSVDLDLKRLLNK